MFIILVLIFSKLLMIVHDLEYLDVLTESSSISKHCACVQRMLWREDSPVPSLLDNAKNDTYKTFRVLAQSHF